MYTHCSQCGQQFNILRILRELIDEKLDWTKAWNHQSALTISEIFSKVQEQYKNMTGGATFSVDLLNSAGDTYFRNKKYTSKPEVKERKRKQSTSSKKCMWYNIPLPFAYIFIVRPDNGVYNVTMIL